MPSFGIFQFLEVKASVPKVHPAAFALVSRSATAASTEAQVDTCLADHVCVAFLFLVVLQHVIGKVPHVFLLLALFCAALNLRLECTLLANKPVGRCVSTPDILHQVDIKGKVPQLVSPDARVRLQAHSLVRAVCVVSV